MGNARDPMTVFYDASLRKEIPLPRELTLQLRLDALNVLNHANFFMNTSASASSGHVLTSTLPTITNGQPGEDYQAAFGKLAAGAIPARILAIGAQLSF